MQKLRKGVSFMMNRKLAVGFGAWTRRRPIAPLDDPMSKLCCT